MKLLFALFSLLVLLFAGALIGPSFVDWSSYKPQIEAQVEKITGYDVILGGELSLSLVPAPRISIEDVTVNAPEGLDVPYLAKVERLELGVALMPLLSKQVQVTGVDIAAPDINIVIGENGEIAGLSSQIEGMRNGQADGVQASSSKPATPIRLDKVSITEGRISLKNLKSKSDMVVSDIDLQASAESLKGPFSGQGSVFFDGKKIAFDANVAALDGSAIRANVKADFDGILTFSGDVAYEGKTIDVANAEIASGQNIARGSVSVQLPEDQGAIGASGNIRSLENVTGQRVISDFNVVLDGSTIDFSDTKLTFGSINSVLDGRYNIEAQNLDIKVKAPLLNTNDLFAGSAGSVASEGGASQNGAVKDLQTRLQNAAAEISIPINMTVDVDVDQGMVANMAFKGLRLSGSAKKNGQLNISRLSIADIVGAQLIAQGQIANVSNLSGFDMSFSVDTQNIQAAAQTLDIDIGALPSGVRALNASVAVKGDIALLDVVSSLKAVGGEFTVSGSIKRPLGDMVADKLGVQVKHPNLTRAIQVTNQKFTAPMPAFNRPVDVSAQISLGDNLVRLKEIEGKIFGSTMAGDLLIKTGSVRPDFSGSLRFGPLDLSSAKSGAVTSSGSRQVVQKSRWSSEPIDPSFLTLANFNLDIEASSLKYAGWDLGNPIFKASLQNGVLTLSEVSAGLYDGRLATSAVVQSAGNALKISAKPSIQNVSLEPLVTSLAQGRLIGGQGRVNMQADLSLLGGSQSSLVRSLAGTGTVTGQDIVIDGIDLTKFARAMSDDIKVGDSLSSLWGGARSGGSTAFTSLDGAFSADKGIITMSKMDLTGGRADIATVGGIDLPKWTLATKHTVTLKDGSDVPPFTMEFKGSLDNPAQTFGQGALQDYLQRKLQRKIQKELQSGSVGRKLQEEIGDKIGIPNLFGGGTQNTAPANDNTQEPESGASQVAPSNNGANDNAPIQRIEPEQVIRGVLDGFLSR